MYLYYQAVNKAIMKTVVRSNQNKTKGQWFGTSEQNPLFKRQSKARVLQVVGETSSPGSGKRKAPLPLHRSNMCL